jgi:precorrin-6B methylase 2
MAKRKNTFSTTQMLSWLGYYADIANLDVEDIKMVNICEKMKNVRPAIETNRYVLLFADENNKDICYVLWEAGLGNCKALVGYGTEPGDSVEKKVITDLMNDDLTGPTALLIENEDAHESFKIGIRNENFTRGPIHYVGHEIRAVIMSMLSVDEEDVLCIVTGESIVIEAAMLAAKGTIIAVETDNGSSVSMSENVDKFGVHNVEIVPDVSLETMRNLPVPRLAFIVASPKMEEQISDLLKLNPHMQFIIYTLELDVLSGIKELFEKYHIHQTEVLQITVAKTNRDSMFVTQPTPWLISGEA